MRIKDVVRRNVNLIPHIIVFIITLFWLFYVDTSYGDHTVYSQALDGTGLWGFIKYQYTHENSKIILDVLVAVMGKLPTVWIVITAFLFSLLGYNIASLFTNHDMKSNITVALLMLIYPMKYMYSAGWCATTINYIWTASLGLLALKPLILFYKRKTVNKTLIPVYMMSLIIGCNHEQVSAIVFCFYFIIILYSLKKKIKIPLLISVLGILSALSLAFLLISPGNINRSHFELQWYPAFENFDIPHKIYLGVVSTIPELIASPNGLILLLVSVLPLVYVNYINDNRKKAIAAALIPLMCFLVKYVFWDMAIATYPMIEIIDKDIMAFTINVAEHSNKEVYISLINAGFCIVFAGSMAVSIFFAFKEKEKGAVAVLVFLAALFSRFIMGFSPTIYASSMRTFSCLAVCFVILIAMIYNDYKHKLNTAIWFGMLSMLSVLQILDTKVLFSGLV